MVIRAQQVVAGLRNHAVAKAKAHFAGGFKVRQTPAANELEEAATTLRKTVASYDKAAKVGLIHQNKADRKKAQLGRVLRQACRAGAGGCGGE